MSQVLGGSFQKGRWYFEARQIPRIVLENTLRQTCATAGRGNFSELGKSGKNFDNPVG